MLCLDRCCTKFWWCCSDDEDRQARSSEMIGAQLIAEAGLVFSCSSLSALTPGTCFNVSGHTALNCERFSVNLLAHPNSRSSREPDIALHINPRLPQNYIVRNCRVAGSWGTEEVTSPMPFRLQRGAPFAMQLLVTEAEYYLSVDGEHFAAFRHRLPFGKVTALQVCGDVVDVQVDQLSILGYPETVARTPAVEVVSAERVREETARLATVAVAAGQTGYRSVSMEGGGEELMDMPYYGRLPSPLAAGHTLHIYGTVKLLPHSFYVNLQHGQQIWPHPVIAFHLNPRFASVGASNVICRNSWHAGRWDREQRSAIHTEFMPSRRFHMEIRVEAERYLVYVNGKCITEYAHRVEVGTVDTVMVQGDIRLQRVWLELNSEAGMLAPP